MLQTVRTEKVDEKNGVICLISMFPSWVMVLKFSKKSSFFTVLCWPQQEMKSIYISESFVSTLLENGRVYRVQATVHEIWAIKI